MPLDALTLSALSTELSEKLVGGRIDKIQQPERDKLLISLRAGGENRKLLIAVGTGNARIHLTNEVFENPPEPPMFCMLMRKHLIGAKILAVRQPGFDRVIEMELSGHDELGFETGRRLIAELIGRSANLILVNSDGRIIDCLRRTVSSGDPERHLLPGMKYQYPPKQNKPLFYDFTPEEVYALCAAADRSIPPDKWLLDSFSGLSPLLCRELSYRCGGDYELLPSACAAFTESMTNGELVPFLVERDGSPIEFSAIPIMQYGSSAKGQQIEDFSTLLDAYYSKKDSLLSRRRKSSELSHIVKTVRDRTVRRLTQRREELRRTETREEVRSRAELIKANLYRIKKGDASAVCTDYYHPDCPEVVIPLDPLKTPQQNAAQLFREYSKLKAARVHLLAFVEEDEKQLSYLDSVLAELERAENEKDISDIRHELTESGFIKKPKNSKPERIKPRQPLRFVTSDGLEVLVGRSNTQNDELTFKLARRTDYWLHTQKVHGSHVILRCDGLIPPETSLAEAASLAVYYSQGRDAGKVAVDYTMVRFVRKPSGAFPGGVIYTDYKTIITDSGTLPERKE